MSFLLAVVLTQTVVGLIIGLLKNRPILGAVLGLCFGMIGWTIIALARVKKPAIEPVATPSGRWAPDPWDSNCQRWWDGQRWTSYTQPNLEAHGANTQKGSSFFSSWRRTQSACNV